MKNGSSVSFTPCSRSNASFSAVRHAQRSVTSTSTIVQACGAVCFDSTMRRAISRRAGVSGMSSSGRWRFAAAGERRCAVRRVPARAGGARRGARRAAAATMSAAVTRPFAAGAAHARRRRPRVRAPAGARPAKRACRSRSRRCCAVRCRRGSRRSRCDGAVRGARAGPAPAIGAACAARADFVDDGDRRAGRNGLAFGDDQLANRARDRRGHFGVDLVGRHLDERFVLLDAVAGLLEPARDRPFGHRLAQLRHANRRAQNCTSSRIAVAHAFGRDHERFFERLRVAHRRNVGSAQAADRRVEIEQRFLRRPSR